MALAISVDARLAGQAAGRRAGGMLRPDAACRTSLDGQPEHAVVDEGAHRRQQVGRERRGVDLEQLGERGDDRADRQLAVARADEGREPGVEATARPKPPPCRSSIAVGSSSPGQ